MMVSKIPLFLNITEKKSAIALKKSTTSTAQILAHLGGGRIASTLPSSEELPATVTLGSGKRRNVCRIPSSQLIY